MWICEISTASDANRFTKGWTGFTESALNSTFFSLNRCDAAAAGSWQLAAAGGSSYSVCTCLHAQAAVGVAANASCCPHACRKGPNLAEVISVPARVMVVFYAFTM
jgi:hypothetical protein